MDKCIENAIEFLKDGKRATVTFSQGRFKSRIKKLVAERPEECQIVAENQDGSICAHIPVKWVKITPTKKLSENQHKQAIENFFKYRSIRHEKTQKRYKS